MDDDINHLRKKIEEYRNKLEGYELSNEFKIAKPDFLYVLADDMLTDGKIPDELMIRIEKRSVNENKSKQIIVEEWIMSSINDLFNDYWQLINLRGVVEKYMFENKEYFDNEKIHNIENIQLASDKLIEITHLSEDGIREKEDMPLLEKFGLDILNDYHTMGCRHDSGIINNFFIGSSVEDNTSWRTILETNIMGMFLEHLNNPRYIDMVLRSTYQDSVTKFVEKIITYPNKDVSRNELLKFNDFFIKYELSYEQPLNFRHIINWLYRWGVFKPINSIEPIIKIYKECSGILHGDLSKSTRTIIEYQDPRLFFKTYSKFMDYILLGIINTIYNMDHFSNQCIKDDSWKDFLDTLNKTDLNLSKKRVQMIKNYDNKK